MVNHLPSYGNANYLWHATKTVNTCQTHKMVRLQTWNYESLIRPDCVNVAHGIYAVQIKTHKRQQSLCRNECSSGVSSSTKRLLLNVYKVSSETWNDVIEFRNFILTRVFFKILCLHCIFSLITYGFVSSTWFILGTKIRHLLLVVTSSTNEIRTNVKAENLRLERTGS